MMYQETPLWLFAKIHIWLVLEPDSTFTRAAKQFVHSTFWKDQWQHIRPSPTYGIIELDKTLDCYKEDNTNPVKEKMREHHHYNTLQLFVIGLAPYDTWKQFKDHMHDVTSLIKSFCPNERQFFIYSPYEGPFRVTHAYHSANKLALTGHGVYLDPGIILDKECTYWYGCTRHFIQRVEYGLLMKLAQIIREFALLRMYFSTFRNPAGYRFNREVTSTQYLQKLIELCRRLG